MSRVILALIAAVAVWPSAFASKPLTPLTTMNRASTECPQGIQFAESIPYGLNLHTNLSTSDSWLELINGATTSIDFAAFYASLSGGSTAAGGAPGQAVYDAIITAAKRGVNVRFTMSKSIEPTFPDTDVYALVKEGYATAVFLDFEKILNASGVLHTKFLIADNATFYVGSANADWRSLTMVKEFGLFVRDCPVLAQELLKVFETYWLVGSKEAVPSPFPSSLTASYSVEHPAVVNLNNSDTSLYMSFAPPPMRPDGWTPDIDAITHHMNTAKSFVHIEMMDFLPNYQYTPTKQYFPAIYETIRASSYTNDTQYRILIGAWNYSIPSQIYYERSLNDLPNVEVRHFLIPPYSVFTPYTRVAHGKWMVTDNSLYIGTSNWVGDYFSSTAGVGVSIHDNKDLLAVSQAAFLRDWNSEYSHELPPVTSSK